MRPISLMKRISVMLTTSLTGIDMSLTSATIGNQFHLIRKLGQYAPLGVDERSALANCLSSRLQVIDRGVPLIELGEAPIDVFVVLDGWAASQRPGGDKRDQTVSLHLPGDVCDFGVLMKRHMDCTIIALSRLKVASISRTMATKLTHDYPLCAQALFWESICANAVRGQWIARNAKGAARERVANFLCEIATRLFVVGLADDSGFDLPITQADFGNACGLTSEHTNRVFRDLRMDNIVSWKDGRLDLLNWDALRALGSFDASYLHFRDLRQSALESPQSLVIGAAVQA